MYKVRNKFKFKHRLEKGAREPKFMKIGDFYIVPRYPDGVKESACVMGWGDNPD